MKISHHGIRSLATELAPFEGITLEELKNSDAQLLNRKERKFLMTRDQFSDLLTRLTGSYRVVEIENDRMSGYSTEYYDTDSFLTYLQHHNGKANRFKLRVRHYLSSGDSYLEIKEKRNTGRTTKQRIQVANDATLSEPKPRAFLTSAFPYDYRAFHPVLTTDYTRVTLVSRKHPERITFDVNLSFHTDVCEYSYPDVVVGEIKHNCPLRQSPAGAVLHTMGIRNTSFSKYCTGISLNYAEVKHNRFKKNLLLLEKLSRGGNSVC
ncbi:polyphosphate polymerase domain-containing protein [Methanogenium organophilum]|uniref:Polyphosphate polymerase domain-containing protein n=1 Tax=Methanogenium organophilum TaxID=2199 RepID=A0A9X9S5A7_METOG|nr:polyphosphate polymerase domain-containing protein [Methanogenium organophilum]WAI01762.1 polyphosphate polymerase domain-containing protein [Methanogenium organophilum]